MNISFEKIIFLRGKKKKVSLGNQESNLILRAGVHKNQTLSGKLQNFKIAQTLAVSSP